MKKKISNICQKVMIFCQQMHNNERKKFSKIHRFRAIFTSMVTLYLRRPLRLEPLLVYFTITSNPVFEKQHPFLCSIFLEVSTQFRRGVGTSFVCFALLFSTIFRWKFQISGSATLHKQRCQNTADIFATIVEYYCIFGCLRK